MVTLLAAKAEIATTHSTFTQISFNMKIAQKKVRMQSPLVNPIINLERPLEKVVQKGKYIAIKCHNTPDDNDSGYNEINLLYYG